MADFGKVALSKIGDLSKNVKGVGLKTPTNKTNISLYFAGDSTSDELLTYSTLNSPTITMHDRLNTNWFANGKPLQGTRKFTFAKSGQTLLDFIQNVNAGAGISDLITKANESLERGQLKLVIFSLGHNGSPLDINYDTRLNEMRTALNRIFNETDAQVLLRMPNAWMESETVTRESALERTNFLNRLYKQVASEYPRTRLLDVQSILGTGAYTQKVWAAGQAVTAGEFRFNENRANTSIGGAVYKATTSGTTGSTIPTGTGTGISDGSVTWDYVGPLNPYMGDHIHMNKLGYEIIADSIGESIISMFSDVKKNKYTPKYLGKPFSDFYYSNSEPTNVPLISGNLIKQNVDKIIIDIDYEKSKNKLQVKDVIKPYGGLGKGIGVTDKVEKPSSRQQSTAYVLGDIVSTVDQYGYPITLECTAAGTSGATSNVSLQADQRNTYITDGTAKWMLISRYHMTQLTYYTTSVIDKGTIVNVYRPFDNVRNVISNLIPSNNYLKLATVRFYTTWSEVDLHFSVIVNGDTMTTASLIDVTLHQSGGWAVANIVDKAIISTRALTTATASLLKNTDIIMVTTDLKTNYREVEIYLKNSSTGNRSYAIQAMGIGNKLQEIDGSQKPQIELLPAMDGDKSTLPTEFTGTVNKTGQYNDALYIARADGQLVKLTVDNSNVITSTLV